MNNLKNKEMKKLILLILCLTWITSSFSQTGTTLPILTDTNVTKKLDSSDYVVITDDKDTFLLFNDSGIKKINKLYTNYAFEKSKADSCKYLFDINMMTCDTAIFHLNNALHKANAISRTKTFIIDKNESIIKNKDVIIKEQQEVNLHLKKVVVRNTVGGVVLGAAVGIIVKTLLDKK